MAYLSFYRHTQTHKYPHTHAFSLSLSPIILYLSTNPFLPLSPHFPKTFSFLSQLRSTPFFEPLSFRVVVVGFTPPPPSFQTQEWAPFWAPLSPPPHTPPSYLCAQFFLEAAFSVDLSLTLTYIRTHSNYLLSLSLFHNAQTLTCTHAHKHSHAHTRTHTHVEEVSA